MQKVRAIEEGHQRKSTDKEMEREEGRRSRSKNIKVKTERAIEAKIWWLIWFWSSVWWRQHHIGRVGGVKKKERGQNQ